MMMMMIIIIIIIIICWMDPLERSKQRKINLECQGSLEVGFIELNSKILCDIYYIWWECHRRSDRTRMALKQQMEKEIVTITLRTHRNHMSSSEGRDCQ